MGIYLAPAENKINGIYILLLVLNQHSPILTRTSYIYSNMQIRSNFSQTCQFSISFYEALAKKPKIIFRFRELIVSGQSIDSK